MKAKFVTMLGIICGVLSAASYTPVAEATNITTSGTACHAYNGSQVTMVDYFSSGAISNTNQFGLAVVCPIPRQPLASGATGGSFYADGSNRNGASTTCTIYSYDFTGAFMGAQSVNSAGTTYDMFFSLTSAQLPFWAYTSAICILPTSGNGTVFGFASVQ